MLTKQQVDTLLRPIRPQRVLKAQGQSHVAAFDVIAHLTRIFGFEGWDKEILSLDLVHERIVEQEDGKVRCWATYRCTMRLTIRDPEGRIIKFIEDAATGSAQNMPSVGDAHDFAVKNAVSYALKRCAKDLGDQFGLSLYNKGQTDALLGKTLVHPDGITEEDVESHAPEPLSMGNDEREMVDEADSELFAELTAAVKGLSAEQKAAFADYGDAEGWPKPRTDMTADQIADGLAWIGRRDG